jgi:hypothetical protein
MPGRTPRLFAILALRGLSPVLTSRGKVRRPPDPTTELIEPAKRPTNAIATTDARCHDATTLDSSVKTNAEIMVDDDV